MKYSNRVGKDVLMFVERDPKTGRLKFVYQPTKLTGHQKIKPKKPKKPKVKVWEKTASPFNDQKLLDDVVISIEKMMEQVPQVNTKGNIYQVTEMLREMNPKAYAPQLISIGPFHHRARDDLKANEQYKFRGFINFLRRIDIGEAKISETARSSKELLETGTLKVLLEKAYGWVKKALNCYATPINMKEEEFSIMMLVDACFIVEFFILKVGRCYQNCEFPRIEGNVTISFYEGIEASITDDIIKLENQIPFFLLQNLFDLIPKNTVPIISSSKDDKKVPMSFSDLAQLALKSVLVSECEIDLNGEPHHLVDFLICYFVPFPPKDIQNNINNSCLCWQKLDEENNDQTKNNDCLTSIKPVYHLWNKIGSKKKQREKGSSNIPPSITELCEAGVSIKKAENGKYMSITFENGVLKIQPLQIYDNFELMLRNIIAFEQFTAGNQKYVTQYVLFLDNLISTEKDVRLLVEAES